MPENHAEPLSEPHGSGHPLLGKAGAPAKLAAAPQCPASPPYSTLHGRGRPTGTEAAELQQTCLYLQGLSLVGTRAGTQVTLVTAWPELSTRRRSSPPSTSSRHAQHTCTHTQVCFPSAHTPTHTHSPTALTSSPHAHTHIVFLSAHTSPPLPACLHAHSTRMAVFIQQHTQHT